MITPKRVEHTIPLSEFEREAEVYFPIPTTWRAGYRMSRQCQVASISRGRIGVCIQLEAADLPVSFELHWGPTLNQRKSMALGRDPKDGKWYLAATFVPDGTADIQLVIQALNATAAPSL